MHLWQQLIERADADRIDVDREAARTFFRTIPFVTPQRFRWAEWQARFQAIRWFADRRRQHVIARWPDSVDATLVSVLRGCRPGLQRRINLTGRGRQDWNIRLALKLTRRDGRLARHVPYDDAVTYWQAVFVGFFDPEQLGSFHGVCGECGKRLPPTTTFRRPTRARLCASCRVRKSREEKPEHYRKYERERKRQERKEQPGQVAGLAQSHRGTA